MNWRWGRETSQLRSESLLSHRPLESPPPLPSRPRPFVHPMCSRPPSPLLIAYAKHDELRPHYSAVYRYPPLCLHYAHRDSGKSLSAKSLSTINPRDVPRQRMRSLTRTPRSLRATIARWLFQKMHREVYSYLSSVSYTRSLCIANYSRHG